MTRLTFANELEQAANQIGDISRADLQILLRRAALRLRNVEGLDLDADVAESLDLVAAELKLSRSEIIQTIICDWLISGGQLPVDPIDEESETDGAA